MLVQEVLDHAKMTLAQPTYEVLKLILLSPGESTVTELRKATALERSHLNKILTRLSERGWIEKTTRATYARAANLHNEKLVRSQG